jgi:hypothetical protein
MKFKSLLLATILCVSGSAFLGAKTRTFTIDRPVLIGNYSLPAGTYRLTVRGDSAEITDLNHFVDRKPVKVSAKKSMGDQRYKDTLVQTVSDSGNNRVTEIDFSHSREAVQFQ